LNQGVFCQLDKRQRRNSGGKDRKQELKKEGGERTKGLVISICWKEGMFITIEVPDRSLRGITRKKRGRREEGKG